ncbi:hypothetical protein Poli38472_005497 [Pythium oligandrum]|uniref:Trehalose 6-phosphate phosphatase n=1 Tax=Pythium oligandrum TaxID=41045 RepID=A0A8K1FJ92_PYTOL|nr:hypothetical protein Poli38472_005497 [Pythium oligandrum]|eukprot:TMW62879.1 hypothetical protein Poli38472_005497 [Pythium oligandrum]
MSAPAPTPAQPTRRMQRLSVSHANALANFDQFIAALAGRRLVIFLDYDGTLTPIVSDPASALLAPETRKILERLHQNFTTGIITGRSLNKIQEFVNIPEFYYAGSHGFDIVGPHGTQIKNQVAVEFLTHLEQIRDTMKSQVADIPGAQVEDNVYSVSLHYRNVDAKYHERMTEIAHGAVAQHPQIKCNDGKMVFEFKPKIDWHKGKALVWLLEALGLDGRDDVFTIFIGDDTTDEDAFEVFHSKSNRNGVGIVVTDHSKPTGATFTLHDTKEVHEFLNKLADYGETKSS